MKFYSARLFLLGILTVAAGCKDDVAENDPPSASGYLFTFNERKLGTPANSSALLPGGDVVICGHDMQIPYNEGDVYRVDQNGNQIWRTNPSPSGLHTDIKGIVSHPNGDIYICGSAVAIGSPSGSEAFMARLNTDGDTAWTRTWTDIGNQKAVCMAVAGDGGLVIVISNALSTGVNEMIVTKVDPDGSPLWTKPFSANYSINFSNLTVCTNEDILIAGYSSFSGWSYEPILIRIDLNGNAVWTKNIILAPPNGYFFYPVSVAELMNGDIMLSGNVQYFPYSYPTYVRLNSAGDTLWTGYLRDSVPNTSINSILEIDADAVVLGGSVAGTLWDDTDNYMLKINSSGQVLWERQFGSSEDNCIMNLFLHGDKILITGESGSNVYLARSGTDGVLK